MAAEYPGSVGDKEETSSVAFSEVRVVWWSVLAQAVSSIGTGQLALAGIIWYAFLSVTYNQFYEPLGINPSDVGLNYASVLANSVGAALIVVVPVILMILVFSVVTLILPLLFLLLLRFSRWRWRRSPVSYYEGGLRYRTVRQELFTRLFGILLVIMAILTSAIIVYQIPIRAGSEADVVRGGEAVGPLHFYNSPFPVLGIHADPVVSIRPATTNKTGESSAVETLQPGRLLYMGQANGMVVFYDSISKQAIYVPASSIVLTVRSSTG